MSKQTAKLIARIAENLPEMPSEIQQGWIENPAALQKALYLALLPAPEYVIWKTIRIGVGSKNADEFCAALKAAGCRFGDWANDILGKPAFTVADQELDLDLVVMSVAELGFKNSAKRSEIYARARELGLDLCPAEVGPQLCLIYKDQPLNEWLLIAMEPITDSGGDLSVFGVARDGRGLWLDGSSGHPGGVWNANDRWVFVRRK